jgi:hypothetical protein
VAAFNHEDHILEHLESIKYLVLTYGANVDVDLIINDDCSIDQTRNLIDHWLRGNASLFRSVKTIYNPKNIGTCASVNNMITHLNVDRCKLSGGDDVYSFENIFDLTKHNSDIAILSGRALYLRDQHLKSNYKSNILATATQVIYQHNDLLHRFKHLSYNNAPNILYATECILHDNVRAYLKRFDVVEDWSLQIAIARQFPERRFMLIDKVLVYYRRTAGSTYIVANQRFIRDKIKMYDDLILNEVNWMERLRLSSRKFCFKSQNYWINKFLNLDLYFFIVSFASQIGNIVKRQRMLDLCHDQHQFHYARIRAAARLMKSSLQGL